MSVQLRFEWQPIRKQYVHIYKFGLHLHGKNDNFLTHLFAEILILRNLYRPHEFKVLTQPLY